MPLSLQRDNLVAEAFTDSVWLWLIVLNQYQTSGDDICVILRFRGIMSVWLSCVFEAVC